MSPSRLSAMCDRRRGRINDTFIHYHFNTPTMHNQLQYSQTELGKQISAKPKEYLFHPLFCILVAYGYLFATRVHLQIYKEISTGTNKIM